MRKQPLEILHEHTPFSNIPEAKEPTIIEAMEEYAAQECIAFAEWVNAGLDDGLAPKLTKELYNDFKNQK